MFKGKSTCRELKRIRKMIAEQNNIPLEDSECHYEGDCAGTCPKCDAEVRFLENALAKSRQLGKAVTLSGMALALSACGNQTPGEIPFDDTVDSADVMMQNDSADTETVKTEAASFPDVDLPILGGDFVIEEINNPDSAVQPPNEEFLTGEVAMDSDYDDMVVYPKLLKSGADIEGSVIVEFMVEKDGSLSNITVRRSLHPALDKEAVSIVQQMPAWIPGKQRGKIAVRSKYTLPIVFTLY